MLTLLDREPSHGYELVRRLNSAGFEAVGYGTVYPLLTRMRRLAIRVSRTGVYLIRHAVRNFSGPLLHRSFEESEAAPLVTPRAAAPELSLPG